MSDTIHTIRTNQAQYDNILDGQRFIAVWNSEEYKVGERIVIRVPGDDYDCGISSRQFLITHVCTHADWPQGVAGPQKIIGFTEVSDSKESGQPSIEDLVRMIDETMELHENLAKAMPSKKYAESLKKARRSLVARQSIPDGELQASGHVITCEKPTGYQPVMVSSMPCGIHQVSVDPYTRTLVACDCSSGYGCERCTPIVQLIENLTQYILNDQIVLENMPSREHMDNLKRYRRELIARQSAKSSI